MHRNEHLPGTPSDEEIARSIDELRLLAKYHGPKDEMVWPKVTRALIVLESLSRERSGMRGNS